MGYKKTHYIKLDAYLRSNFPRFYRTPQIFYGPEPSFKMHTQIYRHLACLSGGGGVETLTPPTPHLKKNLGSFHKHTPQYN